MPRGKGVIGMELLYIAIGLVVFDLLALRFGADSRNIERSLQDPNPPRPQF